MTLLNSNTKSPTQNSLLLLLVNQGYSKEMQENGPVLVTFVRKSHVVYLNSQSDNLYIKQLHFCQLDLR